MMKLTAHQTRVMAALWALTVEHQCRWWSRDDVGAVVGAGGYHQVIQLGTMARLKAAGLVQTERSSWPAEVRQLVHGCNCAGFSWGLTAAGRELAKGLNVRMDDAARERIHAQRTTAILRSREMLDEDEAMARCRRAIEQRMDEDDEGEEWKRG